MHRVWAGLIAGALTLSVAACGSALTAPESAGDVNANHGAEIGIAMPTKRQTRWTADSANMVEQFTAMRYKTDVQFADDNVKKQITQIQAMIDKGVELLVVVAVDGASLNQVLAGAARKHIPVIAYDHLILGTKDVDYYATFDNVRVGVQQGQLLARRLRLPGAAGPFTLELIAGSLIDNNSKVFFDGAMSVLKPSIDSGKLVVRSGQTGFKKVSTENWDGVIAAKRMNEILKKYYTSENLDAVLSPNDSIAGEVIKTLDKNGYGTSAKPMPLITGQDAELTSVKSIIAGRQTGTIYKDTRELAKATVQMSNAILTGTTPIVNDTTTYDNGVKIVPTYLLAPISVDRTNYRTLLVDGGYYRQADLN